MTIATECSVYYIVHMTFCKYIRDHREALKAKDRRFSVLSFPKTHITPYHAATRS